MRLHKRIFYFWLMLFFISVSSFAQSTQTDSTQTNTTQTDTVQNNFPKTLDLDNRQWTLANHQENEDVQLAEYVTNGEDIDNWNELVTFQNFKFAVKKDLTPSMFANVEMDELKKQNYTITFKNVEANDQEAIIEFRVTAPADKQQDEIQRIIITPDHRLIVLHYVIKKADMGETARNNWVNILKNIDVSFLMPPVGNTST